MKTKGLVKYMDDPIYLINETIKWLENYKISLSKNDDGEMKRSLMFIKANIEYLDKIVNRAMR